MSGRSSFSKRNDTGDNILSMFNSHNSSNSNDRKPLALIDDNVFADPNADDREDSDEELSEDATPNFLPLAFNKIKSVVASVVTKLGLPFFN